MADIVLLDDQVSADPDRYRREWMAEVDVVDVYDLPAADLSGYAGLLAGGMIDQEFLHAQRHVIRSFLDAGRVVVWSGHLFRPWLPGCGTFVPKEIRSHHDYEVVVAAPHPVFEGVDPSDLTWRRGVAGFFARGHHPPPPGAHVALALAGGEPVVYVDTDTTPGGIVAHAGTGLVGWGEPGTSAARITPQLFAWIRTEAAT